MSGFLCNREYGEMSARYGRWLTFLLSSAVCACVASCFLFPLQYKYQAVLVPQGEGATSVDGQYVVQEDGSITYELPGLRLRVRPMTDDELNEMFADESTRGKYSVNPYTYGNWVDPRLGYTPNRFTVFEVTINNRTFPKVRLSPIQATLETDRGEFLRAYGITSSSPYNNFENYYRSRRGQSGNEFYRFELRMGLVRSNNYEENQPIFKGENYDGFIVFDAVHPETQTVTLTLNDFALRFGPFGQAVESTELRFDFEHSVHRELVERRAAGRGPAEQLMVSEAGPRLVLGNLPGDRTRDASAMRAAVRQKLPAINECFTEEFDRGTAQEGRVVAEFTVEVGGAVSAARIAESTVDSEPVGQCIRSEILGWTFRPIDLAALRAGETASESGAAEDAPRTAVVRLNPVPVTVTYPFEFEVGELQPGTSR